MNQKEAESVKDLAKDTVEVLGMITESTKKPCRWCGGKGTIWTPLDAQRECHDCDGIGKISQEWKWEPKVGEWFLTAESNLCLIYEVGDCFLRFSCNGKTSPTGMSDSFTPILHWEEIRTIIQGLGFNVEVKVCNEKHTDIWMNTNYRTGPIPIKIATDKPQLAMMRAVIDLRKQKEVTNEKR